MPGSLLISNVSLWDAIDDAPCPGEVLVSGERIELVAKRGERIDPARAAETLDGGGMTLMPGLVEGHCHLSFVGAAEPRELGEIPVEEHLLRTCRNATLLLDHGFTSAFSAASAKLRLDVVVRNEIAAGHLAGPRLRAASPEITVTGGLGDVRRAHLHAESFALIADGVDEIRRTVRLCIREGVDTVKINISGNEFVPHALADLTPMSEAECAAAVDAAHDFGKRVGCHARSAESVKRALRTGVDIIYHCEYADEEALDMLEAAKDRVFLGPAVGILNNAVVDGHRFGMSAEAARTLDLPHILELIGNTYQQLRRRGLRVVVGGDYGFALTPMGENARDIGHFVRYFGYSPAEALRCATAVGGALMSEDGDIGVIRPGAMADMLLVRGNPLQDLALLVGPQHLAMIMQAGRLHRDPRKPI